MFGLPKTTEFDKRIPKQKFYDNLTVSPALKQNFVDQIKIIYWANKIATTTVNLSPGKSVTEIEIFRIKLNSSSLDEAILKQIDRQIPYHILFVLEYEAQIQAWIGYKEIAGSGSAAFKVNHYYHTEWMNESDMTLHMDGLNMDTVYENFVRQIAREVLQSGKEETLKVSVQRDEKAESLRKQIAKLQSKIRKEKQLNRQMELNAELKMLKKELEGLS